MAYGNTPVLIKKVKKVEAHGHHGGAWKVAYADFVTAMMAFFLLMWLINATSPEQKRGIADYFAPANVSESKSGAGGILSGAALGKRGSMESGAVTMSTSSSPPSKTDTQNMGTGGKLNQKYLEKNGSDSLSASKKFDTDDMQSSATSLRQALQEVPELSELSKQLIVDTTPEGLRIQLVDQEGRSMFESGSVTPNARAITLLRAVVRVINPLKNRITITGHTSVENRLRREEDWALSAERANVTRKILTNFGLTPDRIYQISGKAASEPLFPDDPGLPGNRRITLVLLREAPVLPASLR